MCANNLKIKVLIETCFVEELQVVCVANPFVCAKYGANEREKKRRAKIQIEQLSNSGRTAWSIVTTVNERTKRIHTHTDRKH